MGKRVYSHILPLLLFPSLLLASYSPKNKATAQPEESTDATNEPTLNAPSFPQQLLSSLAEGLSLDIQGAIDLGGVDNVIKINDGRLDLAISSFSMHGISLFADLPLTYNEQSLNLALNLHNDWLYVQLTDPTRYDEVELSYKVSLSSMDVTDENGPVEDELTGGIIYYDYGMLDYCIDTILNAITDGGYQYQVSPSKTSPIDAMAILESLNNVSLDPAYDDNAHYLWELPIGEMTLPIGLVGNGILEAINLPNTDSYFVNDGIGYSLNATLADRKANFAVDPAALEYPELNDSLELFKKIALLAVAPQFNLSTGEDGVTVKHSEAAYDGGDYGFARPAIEETAIMKLDSSVDVGGETLKGLSIAASTSCNNHSQSLQIDLVGDNAYLSLNGVVNAYSELSTITALIDSLGGVFGEAAASYDVLFAFLKLNDFISPILNSSLIASLREGRYEEIITLVDSLHNEDNKIVATLDLDKVGLKGQVALTLDGKSNELARIELKEAGASNLTFDGTITIENYVAPEPIDPTLYHHLTHLPTLADGLASFNEARNGSFQVTGYFGKLSEATVPSEIADLAYMQTGFGFRGQAAFDIESQSGMANLTVYDRKAEYRNNHHLQLSYSDQGYVDSQGEKKNSLLFHYDSKNTEPIPDGESGSRTNPNDADGLNGRMEEATFTSMIKVAKTFLTSSDPRFERLTNMFSSVMNSGLIYLLTNSKFLEAISSEFIIAASFSEARDSISFSPDAFGTSEPIEIALNYAESGLASIELKTAIGSVESLQNVYIRIENMESKEVTEIKQQIADVFGNAVYTFTDFSSLGSLMDYFEGSLTLGATENNGYTSTYRLTGSMDIDMPLYGEVKTNFDAFIRLQGSEIMMFFSLNEPLKNIMNIGFDLTRTSGTRYVNLYYYINGNDTANPDGWAYVEQYDVESFWISSSVTARTAKIKGENFNANLLGHILQTTLGYRDLVKDIIDGIKIDTTKAIHGEDLLKDFSSSLDSAGNPSWTFNLGLAAIPMQMLGSNSDVAQLSDLPLTIGSSTLNNGEKTLSSFAGSLSVSVASLLNVSVSFSGSLTNIANGVYQDVFASDYIVNGLVTGVSGKNITTTNASIESFYRDRFYNKDSKQYSAAFNSAAELVDPSYSY